MADAELLAVFRLADRLHKTLGEILEMPASEFFGWIAYLRLC